MSHRGVGDNPISDSLAIFSKENCWLRHEALFFLNFLFLDLDRKFLRHLLFLTLVELVSRLIDLLQW